MKTGLLLSILLVVGCRPGGVEPIEASAASATCDADRPPVGCYGPCGMGCDVKEGCSADGCFDGAACSADGFCCSPTPPECTVRGEQGECEPGEICLGGSCHIACDASRDDPCAWTVFWPECKAIELYGDEGFVCSGRTISVAQ